MLAILVQRAKHLLRGRFPTIHLVSFTRRNEIQAGCIERKTQFSESRYWNQKPLYYGHQWIMH